MYYAYKFIIIRIHISEIYHLLNVKCRPLVKDDLGS